MFSETSVDFQRTTQGYISGDRTLRDRLDEKIKTYLILFLAHNANQNRFTLDRLEYTGFSSVKSLTSRPSKIILDRLYSTDLFI
jgi:hypothetical protein